MDIQLVIRAQQGDEAAFAAITESAYVRMRSTAYRILRDRDLAEDATQQALVGIWRKLPKLSDPARFDAWSYRFLVHACSDEARRSSRSRLNLVAMREPLAQDDFSAVNDRDELERAFTTLSVDQRATIVLRHFLDLTLEDTAEVLGVPVGTVKSRLNRALGKLRVALEADDPISLPTPQEVAR